MARLFATWINICLKTASPKKSLSADTIDNWIAKLAGKLSINTVGNYVYDYILFAKYLQTLNIPAFIPLPLKRRQYYVPYIFSKEEIEAIFNTADNMSYRGKEETKQQFPMILRLLYGCGLRFGETLSLQLSDVDVYNGVIKIRNGKGNKERLVPMDDCLNIILSRYCSVINKAKPEQTLLFENTKGNRRDSVWAIEVFRRILDGAGIELISPSDSPRLRTRNICLNCLRHTFAVSSLRKQIAAGVDTYRSSPLLSIFLGHDNLDSTQKYLHMTAETAEDIFDATTEYTKGLFPEVPQ
jgi:integrase